MNISKERGQEDSSRSAKVPHLALSLEINICEPDTGQVKCPKYYFNERDVVRTQTIGFLLTQSGLFREQIIIYFHEFFDFYSYI